MKKYKNLSGQNVGFLLDGKTYDFQNNEIVSAPDNLVDKVQGIITKIVPYEEPKSVINVPVSAPVEVTATVTVDKPKKKGKTK